MSTGQLLLITGLVLLVMLVVIDLSCHYMNECGIFSTILRLFFVLSIDLNQLDFFNNKHIKRNPFPQKPEKTSTNALNQNP